MMRLATLALVLLAVAPLRAETLAIIHAKAFTMSSAAPVENATIVVVGERISAVSAGGAVPAGARVIDAKGQIVTPGLFAPATQIGLVEILAAHDTDDRSAKTGPLGPSFDTSYAINANSTLIPIARADGVTRAMVVPEASATQPFLGQGALIRLRTDPNLLEHAHAAMFASIGDGSQEKSGGSRAAQWVLLRNALAEARRFGAAPRSIAPRDEQLDRLDIEALQPVVRGAMTLVIKANRESDIREAFRLAAEMHVRIAIYGGVEAWRAAPELAAAHIPVILDPEVNLPQTFDWMAARLDNAAILARAGVRIAFSVSGNTIYLSHAVGRAAREGAGIAVANGLPWIEGLRAITASPAAIWGVPGTGVLAPGADADLVIWDGDPLEPASAPVAVFVAGAPQSLVTRQTELRDRYAPSRAGDPLPPTYR